MISPKIKKEALNTLKFNFRLQVLASAMRQEKEIRGIQIRKEEINLSLFTSDRKIPRNLQKMLLELTNEFSKGAGHNVDIRK